MTLRICIRTVGCRTNQADSLALEMASREAGAEVIDDVREADVVLVNSCAVTARAARDTRRLVGQARRLAPGAHVIVTGCLVEVEGPGTWRGLGADRVVGNADKMQAARIVQEMAPAATAPCAGPRQALRTFRPALKVQEGCSVGCSYCIVPRTRGPERSVPAAQVAREADRLAGQGAHEVVLTGTQLGAWGRDLDPAASLADLVDGLIRGRVVRRVRLSSIEPWGCDPALLEMLATGRKGLCRHLHVPLQSGSARVHEAMGRPGGPELWQAVVGSVDRRVAVGTDVLVGFPGEGPDEFERTRQIVGDSRCAYLHVFPFSPRPGTRAEAMDGRPSEPEVRSRVAALRELSRRLRTEFLGRLMGRRLEVIVERTDPAGTGVSGTSEEFARVLVEDGKADLAGRLVAARARHVEDERVVARLEEVIE